MLLINVLLIPNYARVFLWECYINIVRLTKCDTREEFEQTFFFKQINIPTDAKGEEYLSDH